MNKKLKTNINKNIRQILTLIFVVIIMIIGFCIIKNYNNQNNTLPVSYTLDTIPKYSSSPYVVINNNIPNFIDDDFITTSFENYSNLDELQRCQVAFANLNKIDTMPKENENRKSLNNIFPSGWKDTKYPEIDLDNLYNKCHLIAYSLSAENDNANSHVLYRVTPIYQGENLVPSGVTIEAESVEDKGESICFYVYIYNVQPGVTIDYSTGESKLT